jgi:hypothetical protein
MSTTTTTVATTTLLAPGNAEEYWTRAKIYIGAENYVPTPGATMGMHPMPPRPDIDHERNPRIRSCFTEEFRAELLRETSWEYIDSYTRLTDEEAKVVRDGGNCLRCSGDGYRRRLRGSDTGIIITRRSQCPCNFVKIFLGVWNDPKLVPERFRGVTLGSLVPVGPPASKLSTEMQAKVIAALQANPERSYLLVGDAQTGKTHFSFALFRHAVHEWARIAFEDDAMWERAVFRFNVKSLLDQHVAWERKENREDTPEPDLTVKKIKRLANKKHKVRLFLDEIDKFNPTKFKLDILFELIDSVYETGGQVVAVGNASVSRLEKTWGEYTDANAIIRRIRGEEAHGSQIDFRVGK